MARPVVAIVPFAGRGPDAAAGVIARQLARRLVDRLPDDPDVELRPVFLVTVPETTDATGHLIFGSAPPPDLAAQYGASLGATHALTGTYDGSPGGRTVRVALVDVKTKRVVRRADLPVEPGALQLVEHELGEWLAESTGARARREGLAPAAASEAAYVALLEGMEHEMNATLLRRGDPARAADELGDALDRYLVSAREDPASRAGEERVLVLAAEALERENAGVETRAVEALAELRPRSWRAHYVLARLRAAAGDGSGAVVAYEHARSLHALPDDDLVRLAELYANAGAPGPARAHLRGITATSSAYAAAQELLAIIAFQRGEIDAGRDAYARAVAAGAAGWELHAAHGAALHTRGETAAAAARYRDALERGGPAVVRLNLARVLLASGDRDGSLEQLDAVLASEGTGEAAAQARRLRFGLREPALERELEHAGQQAMSGETQALDGADAVFARALEREPDLWEAQFGRGLVARQRGDTASATRAFRRVLELVPDQPDALHELGVALLASDETEAALRVLDRAAALRPDEAAYTADAGFAHLRAGNLVTARQRLERAARLDADDEVTRTYVAELERAERAAAGT